MEIDQNIDDSFILICRNGYWAGTRPFDINIKTTEFYKKLESTTDQYSLLRFIGQLMEGQYYINFWTAFFILNKFQPDINMKLIGMNDQISIVEECIETVDRYINVFPDKSEKENYQKWLSEVKLRYNIL